MHFQILPLNFCVLVFGLELWPLALGPVLDAQCADPSWLAIVPAHWAAAAVAEGLAAEHDHSCSAQQNAVQHRMVERDKAFDSSNVLNF